MRVPITPGVSVVKLFLVSIAGDKKARAFDPGKPLQASLIFASKAGANPSEVLYSKSKLWPSLKYWTRLKRLSRNKRSSLFVLNLTGEEKKVL
jgi:hypothetical protein